MESLENDGINSTAVWDAMGPLLKPLAYACEFQNSLECFKIIHPALKLSNSFEAGLISNWFVTCTSGEHIQHNAYKILYMLPASFKYYI